LKPGDYTHSTPSEYARIPPSLTSSANQEKHFEADGYSGTIVKSSTRYPALSSSTFFSILQLRVDHMGVSFMSGQVILYFEDQADALRFALAAGSVMAGDGARVTDDLIQETARVSRIRLDAANAGKTKKTVAERVV
jgi:hypothetical protein